MPATMSSQPMLSPSHERFARAKKSRLQDLASALENHTSLSTSLLIGAALQSLLISFLPTLYAVVPTLFLLAYHIADIILITKGIRTNPYLKNVFYKKTTAQVLDSEGNFAGAGEEKIAVLLLGAKSNHPLGIFAPDFGVTGGYLQEMTKELETSDQGETGFLGQTGFSRKDDNGATEILMISYWRSIEHVRAYAHGPLHKKAWLWWDKTLKQHQHIGFMHEVFEAPKGMWEAVYINFQPTLLGATTYLKKDGELQGGEVKEEWVSGLLDANRGTMRTSAGRRGQTHPQADTDKFGKNYYV